MLTTYTPAKGIYAGVAYTLPNETQRKRGLGGADDSIQPARYQGKHYGMGAGQANIAGGTADEVFQITPGWANTHGFNTGNDMADVESAVAKFKCCLVAGGLGTLVDIPPTGFTVNGNAVTQKTCTARYVVGSLSEDWQDGGTVCEITISLENPVGYWTCNDTARSFIPF